MERARATELLSEVLRRCVAGGSWQVDLVDAVYVFGSYARGAQQPGDIDLAVDINRGDPRWRSHFLESVPYGRDPYSILRVELRGRKRSVQLIFEREAHSDIPMTLLWSRGEDLETAIRRVDAIATDPTAGRAKRDAVVPAFGELADDLPRSLRQELVSIIDAGLVTVEAVSLREGSPRGRWIQDDIRFRWSDRSPLLRAANAALTDLQERGVDLRSVHLHGRDLRFARTPYFIGMKLRYIQTLRRAFTEFGGVEWVEIPRPTLRGPLQALLIRRGPAFDPDSWTWSGTSMFT